VAQQLCSSCCCAGQQQEQAAWGVSCSSLLNDTAGSTCNRVGGNSSVSGTENAGGLE
jgi:hypothetical protein